MLSERILWQGSWRADVSKRGLLPISHESCRNTGLSCMAAGYFDQPFDKQQQLPAWQGSWLLTDDWVRCCVKSRCAMGGPVIPTVRFNVTQMVLSERERR